MTFLQISNQDAGIEDFGPQEWVDFWKMVDANMTGDHLYPFNESKAKLIDNLIAARNRLRKQADELCKLIPATSAKTKEAFGAGMDSINRDIEKIMGKRVRL